MIKLQNVTKYYKVNDEKKYILKNVTLTIPTGTNLGIIGRNGAGKSTFLRMLGGIDFPNSGIIDSDVNFSWPMGLSGGFQGSLTGRENAKFVCRFYGQSKVDINNTLKYIYEFCELGTYFDMPIKTYSSGMKGRLNFAMSMAFEFDCYLIDELLAVGDKNFKDKCSKTLNDRKKDKTILLVNHNMGVLKQMCDSGVLLENGTLSYFEDINDAVLEYEKI